MPYNTPPTEGSTLPGPDPLDIDAIRVACDRFTQGKIFGEDLYNYVHSAWDESVTAFTEANADVVRPLVEDKVAEIAATGNMGGVSYTPEAAADYKALLDKYDKTFQRFRYEPPSKSTPRLYDVIKGKFHTYTYPYSHRVPKSPGMFHPMLEKRRAKALSAISTVATMDVVDHKYQWHDHEGSRYPARFTEQSWTVMRIGRDGKLYKPPHFAYMERDYDERTQLSEQYGDGTVGGCDVANLAQLYRILCLPLISDITRSVQERGTVSLEKS